MKKEYERHYHRLESFHWWFCGRRQLVRRLVLHCNSDRDCRILEIGCSAGAMMAELEADGYRHVTGIDISAEAIELCKRNGLKEVYVMDAQRPDFPDRHFDVITASDVLEHLA